MSSTRETLLPIPPVLNEVRPPTYFSPSAFANLLRCPLSVIHGLPEEDLLPPHPLTILGNVIHDVMHTVRTTKPQGDIESAIAEAFDTRLDAVESRLASHPTTRKLVPIRRAIGRTEWRRRKARLRAWSESISVSPEQSSDPRDALYSRRKMGESGENIPATTRVPIGSEKPMKLPDARLSGRPDRIERGSDGVYHITDLKTGKVTNQNGEPFEEYALQVRLYGFMVEQIEPNARVRLWLEGSERVEVRWNDDTRAEISRLLETTLDGLPAYRVLSADSIAREGSHCSRCRIRHRCPRYRSVAPEWWKDTSDTSPVAPFDTWGVVIEVNAEVEWYCEVSIRDAAGRKTRVSGLETETEMQSIDVGDHVWFFDLEPSETLPHHGVFVHPHNFHGKRPSRAWSDALRLRIFVERTNR